MGAGLRASERAGVTWLCIIPRDTLAVPGLPCTPQVPGGAQVGSKITAWGLPGSPCSHTACQSCTGVRLPPGACHRMVPQGWRWEESGMEVPVRDNLTLTFHMLTP